MRNEDGTLNAEEILKNRSRIPPPVRKIWFILTCWRPATKYELKRQQTSFINLSEAVINNYNNLHKLSRHINSLLILLVKKGVIEANEDGTIVQEVINNQDNKEQESDVMFN